jgi:rubrerythrin
VSAPVETRRPIALRHAFRCATCGYGISVATKPQRCPMCGAAARWRPFAERAVVAVQRP